jgi:hypothetical protein
VFEARLGSNAFVDVPFPVAVDNRYLVIVPISAIPNPVLGSHIPATDFEDFDGEVEIVGIDYVRDEFIVTPVSTEAQPRERLIVATPHVDLDVREAEYMHSAKRLALSDAATTAATPPLPACLG